MADSTEPEDNSQALPFDREQFMREMWAAQWHNRAWDAVDLAWKCIDSIEAVIAYAHANPGELLAVDLIPIIHDYCHMAQSRIDTSYDRETYLSRWDNRERQS